ncbi:MAG: RDD family protein [Candidatus Krumholzibacteriia bacterium]
MTHGALQLVTPEGVPLEFRLASVGERITAYALDILLVSLASFLLVLLAMVAGVAEVVALAQVLIFVLRMFYFAWFEHRWQGRTPGKRWQRLHVIDAGGRALPVGAVLARNLIREAEINLPLQVLLSLVFVTVEPDAFWSLFSLVWLLALAIVPLADRQRRRAGDFLAGTVVVRKPEVALVADLAAGRGADPADPELVRPIAGREPVFTPAQLGHYGEYELEVLERLLRRPAVAENLAAFAAVRARIEARTGWLGEPVDDLIFLRAFYAAQRAHLEQRLVMGRRRKDKHADAPQAD